MHFLVVEDNPVNQLLASEMLRALGYPVRTADDGVHAVESCRSDPPAGLRHQSAIWSMAASTNGYFNASARRSGICPSMTVTLE